MGEEEMLQDICSFWVSPSCDDVANRVLGERKSHLARHKMGTHQHIRAKAVGQRKAYSTHALFQYSYVQSSIT